LFCVGGIGASLICGVIRRLGLSAGGLVRYLLALIGLLALSPALADYGTPGVRLSCSNESDDVEIEAFIAWDGGNTPYPEYDVDKIGEVVVLRRKQNEYFLSPDDTNPVTQECSHAGRLIRVTIYQGQLTVSEPGRLVNEFRIRNVWVGVARYLLRSPTPNKWEECIGTARIPTRDFLCRPFNPAKPIDVTRTNDGTQLSP
jgi:hypothetical protein